MEKIKRYIGLERSRYLEHDEGQVCFYEDHLAALREIFPDWPEEYPTDDGLYYIRRSGVFDIVQVGLASSVAHFRDRGVWRHVSDTNPEIWGPRVPMWRKI